MLPAFPVRCRLCEQTEGTMHEVALAALNGEDNQQAMWV